MFVKASLIITHFLLAGASDNCSEGGSSAAHRSLLQSLKVIHKPCDDTDSGATDPGGYSCKGYFGHPSWCGKYDGSSFRSSEMCCACGGGITTVSAGRGMRTLDAVSIRSFHNKFLSAPLPPSIRCKDGVKNYDETGVDCGGACSKGCETGKPCNVNSDCETNSCSSADKVCVAKDKCVGDRNTWDAGFGKCDSYTKGKANHDYCSQDSQSGILAKSVCEECGSCSRPWKRCVSPSPDVVDALNGLCKTTPTTPGTKPPVQITVLGTIGGWGSWFNFYNDPALSLKPGTYTITQCRHGEPRWKGDITWWAHRPNRFDANAKLNADESFNLYGAGDSFGRLVDKWVARNAWWKENDVIVFFGGDCAWASPVLSEDFVSADLSETFNMIKDTATGKFAFRAHGGGAYLSAGAAATAAITMAPKMGLSELFDLEVENLKNKDYVLNHIKTTHGTYLSALGERGDYRFGQSIVRSEQTRFGILDHKFDGEALEVGVLFINDHVRVAKSGVAATEAETLDMFQRSAQLMNRLWFHQIGRWNGRIKLKLSGQLSPFAHTKDFWGDAKSHGKLQQLRDWVVSNKGSATFTALDYDYVHLISGRKTTPAGLRGATNSGGICTNQNVGFSDTSISVFIHEMAHNLGAHHDDAKQCMGTCESHIWNERKGCDQQHLMGGLWRPLFSACSISSMSDFLSTSPCIRVPNGPLPACVGVPSGNIVKYGGCKSYAWAQNHEHCATDTNSKGAVANKVCEECGRCTTT